MGTDRISRTDSIIETNRIVETDRIIYFRADGNSEIATGHIMRCLSIARACLAMNKTCLANSKAVSVCFLVSDTESKSLLLDLLEENEPISVAILEEADYSNCEKELPALIDYLCEHSGYINKHNADLSKHHINSSESIESSDCKPVFFLDSYFITAHYLKEISAYAKIVYLDDLRAFDYPVDLVINYDVISKELLPEYEASYSKAKQKLLGSKYTPLRTQFKERPLWWEQLEKDFVPLPENYALKLFIATGGSDPYCTTLHLLTHLLEQQEKQTDKEINFPIECHVVIGRMNADKKEIQKLSKTHLNLFLYEKVTDIANLMIHCDLALSAAGTTLYELCALGVPTASFVLADNQIAGAKAFDQAGAIPFLGDVRTDEKAVLNAGKDFILSMQDFKTRKKATEQMRQLVDGYGAERIATAILAL